MENKLKRFHELINMINKIIFKNTEYFDFNHFVIDYNIRNISRSSMKELTTGQ